VTISEMGRHGATQFSGAYWDFIQHGGQMRQLQTAWQARTVLLWEEGGGRPGGITEDWVQDMPGDGEPQL
jgi:hypothetical protein